MYKQSSQVSAMVGNIRNMANDMNTALVRQNQTLDRINAKDASDIQRVKMANERAAALCKQIMDHPGNNQQHPILILYVYLCSRSLLLTLLSQPRCLASDSDAILHSAQCTSQWRLAFHLLHPLKQTRGHNGR